MTIMTQDMGALAFLNARLNNTFPTSKDLTVHLFCNNITPSDSDVVGDYTEASGAGYAAQTLTTGSWTISIVSNLAQAVYGTLTFALTGVLTTNTTVYGYYVTDDNGDLMWADTLTTPFDTSPNVPGYIAIDITYKASKGTPS
jgi:hypothetical protein